MHKIIVSVLGNVNFVIENASTKQVIFNKWLTIKILGYKTLIGFLTVNKGISTACHCNDHERSLKYKDSTLVHSLTCTLICYCLSLNTVFKSLFMICDFVLLHLIWDKLKIWKIWIMLDYRWWGM